jgi:signal transduction histidine kinase
MTRRDSETKCFFGCQRLGKHVSNFAQLVAINLSCGTRVNGMGRQLSRARQFKDFTSGKAQMFCYALSINVGFLCSGFRERDGRNMLDGFDKDWSDASLNRVAYYTNVPPGKYRFRVAAFALSNPDQLVEASLEIVQEPHFYRTPWFLACCLVMLALIVWGLYEMRLAQVHSRFQAVLKERNRLAREMHDTVIQGCASVSALLEAHSSMDGLSDKNSDLLEYARVQLRTTMDEARQAVSDLRQAAEENADIIPLLRKTVERVGHEFAVPIECHFGGKPFAFDRATMHDALMITREALYNSVRHGRPSRVEVHAHFEDAFCTLQIRDDGDGFDPDAKTNGGNHYGLLGIRERVERIGGSMNISSRAGFGTTVMVRISRDSQSRTKPEVPEVVL